MANLRWTTYVSDEIELTFDGNQEIAVNATLMQDDGTAEITLGDTTKTVALRAVATGLLD